MRLFRKSEKSRQSEAAGSESGAEKRRAPRFATNVISCMLGKVVDLSSAGMRITAPKVPPLGIGDMVRLELSSPRDTLVVVGRIVRLARNGPVYDIGVEFQQVAPEVAAALESLARFGCIKGKRPAAEPGNIGGISASAQLADLYEILGVEREATLEEIHRAFRDLARKSHPDLNPSAEAQAKFIQLHKAYDVLRDPEKRRSYDDAVARSQARPAA